MIAVSPHTYRTEGLRRGRSLETLDNALIQSQPPETAGAPAILTLAHLAFRTDISRHWLRHAVASRTGEHYRDFTISKRSGGGRRIAVPDPNLMAVQRWIVREILRGRHVHEISHAYAKGSSIVKCASQHAGAGWLLKLDIHDFFENIPERKVYRVFREIGYQPLVSFELARLCTRPWVNPPDESVKRRSVANPQRRGPAFYARDYTGYLPQGAPTSPMLSNLVCRRLDIELAALAKRTGLVVTRYSDDITFSGSASGFDRALAMSLVEDVRTALSKHGFRLHERKISVVPPGARKVVLGLLVDRDRPRLTRDFRQKVTDHVRGIEKFGLARHAATRKFDAMTGMVEHIAGLIRFAGHVDSGFSDPLRLRFEAALAQQHWTPSY
ncbi:RNA-directed DNA polymerase [Sphingomonas sp. UYAg733]